MPQHQKRLLIAFACCFLFSGCSTTTSVAPKKITSLSADRSVSTQSNSLPPRGVQPSPQSTPQPTAPRVNSPVIANAPAVAPETWVRLDDFCRQHGCACAQQTSRTTTISFECSKGPDRFRITEGAKQIVWNGTEIWLGFAPRRSGNHVLIRGIDIQETLAPLLELRGASRGPLKTLVLDPGHGGKDYGARSTSNQLSEKDLTLDWAKRLRALLIRQGFKVFLTRTNDLYLTLPERVAFADSVNADLFLSLHFNSFDGKTMSGVETYCMTPRGLPSTLTRGFHDDPSATFPNNSFDRDNLKYALRVHRALVDVTGAEDHGVRRARFMGVLRNQARPAVLIEGGYLSNPDEAQQIGSGGYRQKLADAIAIALSAPYPTGPIPGPAAMRDENAGRRNP